MNKILVIEDNRDNLTIITYALKRAGFEVAHAERGEDGLALALTGGWACILMDINLPGMDGIETTHRIRSSKLDGLIPIIAITSYAMQGDRERFLAAGCTAYIEKPIDPITLGDRVREVIRQFTPGS